MSPFLQEVAEYIFKEEQDKLHECCLVFPGRRAALFFRNYLSRYVSKPVWSPDFMTISGFMLKITGFRKAHHIHLVFMLYRIYRSMVNTAESFDDFYSFGEVLINDFDDLDKNQVKAGDLFKNLASVKEMEDHFSYLDEDQLSAIQTFWKNFQISRDSSDKKQFLDLWQILDPLYQAFRKECLKSGSVYEGLAYREAVKILQAADKLPDNYRKMYFIGFNALTKSETILFKNLADREQGVFFWDYAEAYTKDPLHEAGTFIRKNKDIFPEPAGQIDHSRFLNELESMESLAAPTDPAQVQLMSQCLVRWNKEGYVSKSNTAIVLADEQLLGTVIHAIPPEFSDINITMGYPLKNTPVHDLVLILIDLQRNLKSSEGSGQSRFYHKDVLSLLNHQYISGLNLPGHKELRDRVVQENQIYPFSKMLQIDEFTRLVFQQNGDPAGISTYIEEVLYWLYIRNPGEQEGMDLQREYLYYVYLSVHRLKELLTEEHEGIELATYRKLLVKIIRGVSIPFSGEPLKGLQVMGVLETRALDFENLIILSMNEGIFPGKSATFSVIPPNIRKGFGLPTSEHQDRIYAYYFYRLIQKARRITFIWSTKDSGLRKGEVSRYIYQLKYLYNLPLKEYALNQVVRRQKEREIRIEKGPAIYQAILQKASGEKNFLSPSALNNYINCPLQFYYKYIVKIREPESVDEVVDPRLFGSILHETLKVLYQPFLDATTPVTREKLEVLKSEGKATKKVLLNIFKQLWFKLPVDKSDERDLTGMNLIILDILYKYLNQVIDQDLKKVPFRILSLENSYKKSIEVETSHRTESIRIGGIIDRVDQVNEVIRVLDYKTGLVSKSFPTLSSLFEHETKNRNGEAFQTLMYCWLYTPSDPSLLLLPGLYDIRGMHSQTFEPGFKAGKIPLSDFNLVRQDFETSLEALLKELLDEQIPFFQTEDDEKCKYCLYNGICKRD